MSRTIILGLCIFFIIALVYWQVFAYRVAEPNYTVVRSEGAIEVRDYPAMLIAEVSMKGERYSAINAGFRSLAGYIFGKNKSNQKIAMTAPVMQQESEQGWYVRFVMPAGYALENLSVPLEKNIRLKELASQKYLVIRFSGMNSEKNINMHLKEITDYAAKNKIQLFGEPIFAFYNPPWILPFLRRNEIMFSLQKE